MPLVYGAVLRDSIMSEIRGQFGYGPHDKKILKEMTKEINKTLGTHIHYLAEIDAYNIHGAGKIMKDYIYRYESETIKAYLVSQFVNDKIDNCAKIVLDLYKGFKESDEYNPGPGKSSPVHIYMKYDNAFRRLKPKRQKEELLELLAFPRDAFYLPFTTVMVASWKDPRMLDILMKFFDAGSISPEDVGIKDGVEGYHPSIEAIQRELRFTAVEGLKYFPTDAVLQKLQTLSECDNKDFRDAANKSIQYIKKHFVNQ